MAKQRNNTKPTATTVDAGVTTPATVDAGVTTAPAVDAGVTPITWQPAPRYATAIANANKVGAASQAPGAPVLTSCNVALVNVRPSTCRYAVLAALLANIGNNLTRHQAIQVAANAEQQWHQSQGRTPAGVAPAGWLKNLGAVFAVPEQQ